MGILTRKKSGQFIKARVRVGDLAVCSGSSKVLGVTGGRFYTVVATALSKDSNKVSDSNSVIAETDRDFIFINDRGERTLGKLPSLTIEKYSIKTSVPFMEWAVI